MIDIINFDSWDAYDGFSEGSGRSEKIWLESKNGQIGLFKFPKIDPVSGKETTEHISEHLAYRLGEILDISVAKVDIGKREGRIGSMSYFVCKPNESLQEGIGFISGKYPTYNAETMQDEANKRYYCIEHILNSVPKGIPNRIWIEMMMFDFLIGNTDRHQSNWALLFNIDFEKQIKISIKQCPLYDNGSSLCCYVNEMQLPDLLGNDMNRFQALADTKSLSIIRIDGTQKKRPTHREVVRHLLQNYPVAKDIAMHFSLCLNEDIIIDILKDYQTELISDDKKELIKRYLLKKLDILNELLKEVRIDVTDI